MIYPSFIPETFREIPSDTRFVFAPIDLEIFPSVMESFALFVPTIWRPWNNVVWR